MKNSLESPEHNLFIEHFNLIMKQEHCQGTKAIKEVFK